MLFRQVRLIWHLNITLNILDTFPFMSSKRKPHNHRRKIIEPSLYSHDKTMKSNETCDTSIHMSTIATQDFKHRPRQAKRNFKRIYFLLWLFKLECLISTANAKLALLHLLSTVNNGILHLLTKWFKLFPIYMWFSLFPSIKHSFITETNIIRCWTLLATIKVDNNSVAALFYYCYYNSDTKLIKRMVLRDLPSMVVIFTVYNCL